jgi:hypothetical protein
MILHIFPSDKRATTGCPLVLVLNILLPESDNNYSGQFKLRIPKSLHRSLAERSKAEGISMNQYCLYLLARNDALTMKQEAMEDLFE